VSVALIQSLLLLLGWLCVLLLLAAAALLLGSWRGQAVPPQLAGLQAAGGGGGSNGSMESMAVLSTPYPRCHNTHLAPAHTAIRGTRRCCVLCKHTLQLLKLVASNSAGSPRCTLPHADLTPPNLALRHWNQTQIQSKHGIPYQQETLQLTCWSCCLCPVIWRGCGEVKPTTLLVPRRQRVAVVVVHRRQVLVACSKSGPIQNNNAWRGQHNGTGKRQGQALLCSAAMGASMNSPGSTLLLEREGAPYPKLHEQPLVALGALLL
jgi:hypothetical protein